MEPLISRIFRKFRAASVGCEPHLGSNMQVGNRSLIRKAFKALVMPLVGIDLGAVEDAQNTRK